MKLGEKVRIVRNLKQISQTWVAMKLKISQQAYQKLEQGKTIMTNNKLAEIAKLLDIDEQTIRDIDTLPIINKSNSQGKKLNSNSVFNSNRLAIDEKDRIQSIEKEVDNLKKKIDSLTHLIETKFK
ncbi:MULTISPECIES: helix-turn-helix transcriptional regulator [unclassified Arcicella]|uniref:helix-turn-helix domain-containing protein n=1 Tax=unclassified Arcicella TaxID=2644986 RepID=UPI002864993A|nr:MULTISPECIES: helix-turn-helix transcriptional regulator [unclassified Arcicella]MDR6562843.1 transcriptional regulator with XRE-family HTH domain [Arcicella sp. BE51]MDR6812816.1 transcriptional regulator with XRE-family HTH domain [Arcicella sp. BE140]MDR6824128.1 transcriptional regulator with XRE-family HTH domain [Arcicella sp. BE139]